MPDQAREVYQGRIAHHCGHDVTLPNGHRTTLEVIRHPGASAVVPFVSSDEVLLVRQYRFATGGYLLEVPAGKLDPGEPPEDCARRETEEETGHDVGRLEKLGAIWPTPGFTDEIIHRFAAHDLEPTRTNRGADEVMTVERVRLVDALDKIGRASCR